MRLKLRKGPSSIKVISLLYKYVAGFPVNKYKKWQIAVWCSAELRLINLYTNCIFQI